MQHTNPILDALQNPTVAAVIGSAAAALATYGAVAFTDKRRDRRRARKLIPYQLEIYRVLTRNRIEGAENARASLMRPGMPVQDVADRFPVASIRRQVEELAEHLRPEQAMALYNIAFVMERADLLNAAALSHIDKRQRGPSDLERTVSDEETRGALMITYSEELFALKHVDALIGAYISDQLTSTGGSASGAHE